MFGLKCSLNTNVDNRLHREVLCVIVFYGWNDCLNETLEIQLDSCAPVGPARLLQRFA